MKKWFLQWNLWIISLINIGVLITNLCYLSYFYPRYETLSFDYLGLIVGVLSFLVTLLLGWQIFSSIDTKNKIEKIETLQNILKEKIDSFKEFQIKEEKKMRYHISRMQGLSLYEKQPYTAYIAFFDSLETALKINNSEYAYTSLNDLQGVANIIQKSKIANGSDDENIKSLSIDRLKDYELFSLIKDRYLSIYNSSSNSIPKSNNID